MTTYARVLGDIVAEMMSTTGPAPICNSAIGQWLYVADSVNPQPAIGWSYANGTYTAPSPPPQPSLAQQAQAAATAGLTITLSGTITLAATLFPTDLVTQGKLSAVITTLTAIGTFPDGATSYPLKDAAGDWHTLTIKQYTTIAGAIAAYVAACDMIADGNPLSATELPANSVSLTV